MNKFILSTCLLFCYFLPTFAQAARTEAADTVTTETPDTKEARRQRVAQRNLHYNISVPLLTGCLKNINAYQSLTLMFQKEVAERIMAPINTKDYGRISVLAQLTCKIEKLFDLNPNCFTPAPKVWSTVLLFRPLTCTPSPQQLKKIEHLTSLAFGQRRKMIRQSLKQIPALAEKLKTLNIPDTFRDEQLTPQQYLQLADLI